MKGLMDKMIATAIDECDVNDDLAFIQAIYAAQISGGFPGYASAVCDGLLKKRDAAIRAECADRAVKCFFTTMAESGLSSGNDYAVLVISDKIRAAIMGEEGR